MRAIILAAVAALAFASAAGAVPHCGKGKLCGDACIKATDVCHVPPLVRNCGVGKLCGKTCIPKTATCHKTASNDFGASGPYVGLKYVGDVGGAH